MMKKVKTNNNIKRFKCHKKIRKFQLFNPKTKKNYNHNIIGEFRDRKDFKKRSSAQETEIRIY
jgi:hypothetical protein